MDMWLVCVVVLQGGIYAGVQHVGLDQYESSLAETVLGMVALSTCDSYVTGSSPGRAPLHSGLGQATYICVPLSPSSITWYQSKDSDALRLER